MRKFYLALLVSLLFIQFSHAQSFYNARRERSLIFVGGMGLSTYFGELKVGNSFDTKPTLNAGLQYYLSPHISARVDATWFQLRGSDADSGVPNRVKRNLSFFSNNLEISGTFAFSFISAGERYYRRPTINAYAFTGIGICYFNPTTEYKGETYSLPQYKTEGVAYSTFTPVIPIGLGVRVKVTRDINLALEGGYRMTFTDYLDDVSNKYPTTFSTDPIGKALSYRGAEVGAGSAEQNAGGLRGNPKSNDSYFLLNVKLEYYLPTDFIFGKNQGQKKATHYKKKKYHYIKPKGR